MPLENSRRGRKTDEEFVLFLQGIPAHCRWQELKDLVRQTALHIRQAVVYDDHHGFPTGLGQIIVKHEEAAWRTYQSLSATGWEGQSLVVTLARMNSPTHPIAGPTKSPPCMFTGAGYGGYSTSPRTAQNLAIPTSPISPESPLTTTSPTYPCAEYGLGLNPMALPHPHQHSFLPVYFDSIPLSSMPSFHTTCDQPPPPSSVPILPTYPMPMSIPRHPPRGPRKQVPNYYHNNTTTTTTTNPNNTNTNTNTTNPKAIFIQNLPPGTTPKTLKQHFHTLLSDSTITSCEVFADRATGLCRGYARVWFVDGEEARRAVGVSNGTGFLGAWIRVRFDRGYGSRGRERERTRERERGYGSVSVGVSGSSSGSTTTGCETGDKDTSQQQQQQQPLVVNGSGSGSARKEVTVECG